MATTANQRQHNQTGEDDFPERSPRSGRTSPRVQSARIQETLDTLARKIRVYVVVHGLILACLWLALSYWLALMIDRVPAWFGQTDLSRGTRLVLLALIVGGLGWILYRFVFQRVQRRLSHENMALLLERRFPEFNDSLATSVLSDSGDASLLQQAEQQAEFTIDKISIVDVLNYRPIISTGFAALALIGSIGWFAANFGNTFRTGVQRVYLLSDQPWPRACRVELIGSKVKHDYAIEGLPELSEVRHFEDDSMIVGKGSEVSILVRAEQPNDDNPKRRLPNRCELLYRTASGTSGRLTMSKVGGSESGYQNYALDSDLLQSINENVTFSVRGDDHRIGPFQLRTVAPPLLSGIEVDCQYPDYLIDEASSRYTRRKVAFASGLDLPIGTNATLLGVCDRPLQRVLLIDSENQIQGQAEFNNGDSSNDALVNAPLKTIDADALKFSIVIMDEHGLFSSAPQPIEIRSKLDQVPSLSTRLEGIGSAVTDQAIIRATGQVSEDNGLQKLWSQLAIQQADALADPLTGPPPAIGTDDKITVEFDLQKMRDTGQLPPLNTESPATISLNLFAQDYYDLNGESNIGRSEPHTLDLVSSDQLLRILERDEAEQRARLEQILRETNEAREHIVRARRTGNRNGSSSETGFEPGDQPQRESSTDPTKVDEIEELALRQLFAQRALLQTQKSSSELQGVAESFRDIRLQLINNRIDAEDRKERLLKKVEQPLRQLVSTTISELQQSLNDCEAGFQQLQSVGAVAENAGLANANLERSSFEALERTDLAIVEIQTVLSSLLKFETQNELLDIVRRLLDEQEKLEQRTKAVREKEAFDDIFNK